MGCHQRGLSWCLGPAPSPHTYTDWTWWTQSLLQRIQTFAHPNSSFRLPEDQGFEMKPRPLCKLLPDSSFMLNLSCHPLPATAEIASGHMRRWQQALLCSCSWLSWPLLASRSAVEAMFPNTHPSAYTPIPCLVSLPCLLLHLDFGGQ